MSLSIVATKSFCILLAFIYLMLPVPPSSVFSFDIMVLLFLSFCFASPKRPPTLFFAWSIGLAQDILLKSQLGEHAFSLCVTAFMCLSLLRRMQFFVLWQQVICVGCLTLINQLLIALIEGGQGHFIPLFGYFSSAIMNMAFWVFIGYGFVHQKHYNAVLSER